MQTRLCVVAVLHRWTLRTSGFGDVILDTPKIVMEFFALATGMISTSNLGLFIFAIVLKSLSGISHIYTLYQDIRLFFQERSQVQLRAMRQKFAKRMAKSFALRRRASTGSDAGFPLEGLGEEVEEEHEVAGGMHSPRPGGVLLGAPTGTAPESARPTSQPSSTGRLLPHSHHDLSDSGSDDTIAIGL